MPLLPIAIKTGPLTSFFYLCKMSEAVIILGGNEGNVKETFLGCKKRFESRGYKLSNISSIYSSPSWGYDSENRFYNQVLTFKTNKSPQDVLKDCLLLETEFGRLRDNSGEYHDRPIDIDILFYDEATVEEENLTIPHPRLHERKFCLVPLLEIAPGFIHPVLKKTIGELLAQCTDESKITRE